MRKIRILWTDDEIDLLKPHIMFLEDKGYEVSTSTNGDDALELVESTDFDLVLLDENMPGMSGLETLSRIKTINANLPVIMITKNEEEDIMDAAIGSKISDYLIKPVNPKQILLAIKKNIDTQRLISKETTSAYQADFGKISMEISSASTHEEWADVYKKLVYWELELGNSIDRSLEEVLKMQKQDANNGFAKFIQRNYVSWFSNNNQDKPLLSPNLVSQKVIPALNDEEKVFFIVIDNLRYDQWCLLSKELSDFYKIEDELLYYSILPSATQYARNAIFSGLMPLEISKMLPQFWVDEDEEEKKNNYESELLDKQLNRLGYKNKFVYHKILQQKVGKKLVDNYKSLLNYNLVALVYNFVDMLSHARTDIDMIRELAGDEAAYRSLTLSWFRHSELLNLLELLAEEDVKVIITTDHGTINVQNPIKVVGDKNSSVNLRYKQGRNLNYNPRQVFEITNPAEIHLPSINVSTSYIFAQSNDFMAYPKNYNYYVNYYKNTFQHGGISMEEMIVPIATLTPKR